MLFHNVDTVSPSGAQTTPNAMLNNRQLAIFCKPFRYLSHCRCSVHTNSRTMFAVKIYTRLLFYRGWYIFVNFSHDICRCMRKSTRRVVFHSIKFTHGVLLRKAAKWPDRRPADPTSFGTKSLYAWNEIEPTKCFTISETGQKISPIVDLYKLPNNRL